MPQRRAEGWALVSVDLLKNVVSRVSWSPALTLKMFKSRKLMSVSALVRVNLKGD